MKLGPKKDPNSLNDAMASIECQYSIEMTNGKEKGTGSETWGSHLLIDHHVDSDDLAGERKRASSSHSLEQDAHSMASCGRKEQGQEKFR